MQSCFRRTFIEHPESVGENYFTHGYKACLFGVTLISYGVAELIHAIVPRIDLFELFGTRSDIEISKLSDELKYRKQIANNKAD